MPFHKQMLHTPYPLDVSIPADELFEVMGYASVPLTTWGLSRVHGKYNVCTRIPGQGGSGGNKQFALGYLVSVFWWAPIKEE